MSWQPVLVVDETGVPGENHRPWASNWQALSPVSRAHLHETLDILKGHSRMNYPETQATLDTIKH
jgi:hypothetical protein